MDFQNHICKYKPISGSSYIELPERIRNKRCCINVQNNDQYCFMWAILSALFPPERDGQRVSMYRNYINKLNWSGINYPASLQEFKRFERTIRESRLTYFDWMKNKKE